MVALDQVCPYVVVTPISHDTSASARKNKDCKDKTCNLSHNVDSAIARYGQLRSLAHISLCLELCPELGRQGDADLVSVCCRDLVVNGNLESSSAQLR